MDVFNPKILDASIRDVASNLSDDQKAGLLLYAMQNLSLEGRSRTVIENAVQSCLQVASLSPQNTAKARVLRAKARLAAGSLIGARQDLEAALMADPDDLEANALLNKQATPEQRLLPQPRTGVRFSNEIWREVATFLPRRDLKTLLFVPHTLSRVASQLLFHKIDLHFSSGEVEEEGDVWDPQRPAAVRDQEAREARRSADILSRIIVDPTFAALVRTLRLYSPKQDKDGTLAFQTGMLANALPRLGNLRNVHITASCEGLGLILRILQTTSPRLRGLSLASIDGPGDLSFLDMKNLTQFCYATTGGSPAGVHAFVAQNRASLRAISLDNQFWTFPSEALSIRNLTHIDFSGRLPADSQAFGDILANGRQLESLRLHCLLDCAPSAQFRAAPDALPFLRHFALTVAGMNRRASDRDLLPAIAEFLRGRAALRTLHLVVPDAVQRAVGFDAAAWGVLPSLAGLRGLAITYPPDLAAGLALWLVPRSVRALHLDCAPAAARDPASFLAQLRAGAPPALAFIGLPDFPLRAPAAIVEAGFPMARLVRVGGAYWTVHRAADGALAEMEQWPRERARAHAEEWLEWLGCEDARWRDPTEFVL